MPDNLSIRKPEDPTRINITQPWEVDYWCKNLNCNKNDLQRAVSIVGPIVNDVRNWIERNRR